MRIIGWVCNRLFCWLRLCVIICCLCLRNPPKGTRIATQTSQQQQQKMTIPDISYHLTFCFLTLHELTLIAQCSKEWNRIVTFPFFIQMFRHNSVLKIMNQHNEKQHELKSPFHQVIREIEIEQANVSKFLYSLMHFSRLQSLDLSLIYHYAEDYCKVDFLPIFKTLGTNLIQLKLKLKNSYFSMSKQPFQNFHDTLRYLTCLKSLNLSFINNLEDAEGLKDITFLSYMNQLEIFICDCIDVNANMNHIIDSLLSCSTLVHLKLNGCFLACDNRNNELCLALKNSKLKHIGTITNGKNQDFIDSEILSQFVHLQTIDIRINNDRYVPAVPTKLGKWIRNLAVNWRHISDQDVLNMISFKQLKSINFFATSIDLEQMKTLIDGISSQLENLILQSIFGGHIEITFEIISKCSNLKTLGLNNINLKFEEFDLLTNCKQIESITIINCETNSPKRLSIDMKQALQLPSKIFTKLKTVQFDCYEMISLVFD
jgi:hypothetical protein